MASLKPDRLTDINLASAPGHNGAQERKQLMIGGEDDANEEGEEESLVPRRPLAVGWQQQSACRGCCCCCFRLWSRTLVPSDWPLAGGSNSARLDKRRTLSLAVCSRRLLQVGKYATKAAAAPMPVAFRCGDLNENVSFHCRPPCCRRLEMRMWVANFAIFIPLAPLSFLIPLRRNKEQLSAPLAVRPYL